MKTLLIITAFLFSLISFAGTTPSKTSLWGSVPPSASHPGDAIYFISISTGGNDLEYRFSSSLSGGQPQVLKDWGRDNFLNTTLPLIFSDVVFIVDVRGVGQTNFVSASQAYGFLQDISISDDVLVAGELLKISHLSFHLGQNFSTNFISKDGFSETVTSSVMVEGELQVTVPAYKDPITHVETKGEVSIFVTGVGTRTRPMLFIDFGNELPEPHFSMNPPSAFAFAPAQISFDGSTSFDSDGTITRFDWEFGDGTTASGPQANHLYSEEGVYFVKLTITDNSGWKNRLIQAVNISLNIPAVENFSAGEIILVQDPNDLFYPLVTDLVFDVTGAELNTDLGQLQLTLNGVDLVNPNVTISTTQIHLDNLTLVDGKNILEVAATDEAGLPLMKEFTLWAGNQNLTVNLSNKSNNSVTNAEVTIKLLEDQTILRKITNVNGSVIIDNLPSETSQGFVISAKSNNLLAIEDLETLPESISLTLLGFKPVSTIDNDDFSQGTDGWDISEANPEIVPHEDKFDIIKNNNLNDQDMRLSLENSTYQKVTRTITVTDIQAKFYDLNYRLTQSSNGIFQIVMRNATTSEISSLIRNEKEEAFWQNIRIPAKLGDVLQVEVSLKNSLNKNRRALDYEVLDIGNITSSPFSIEEIKFYNLNLRTDPVDETKSEIFGLSVGPRDDFGPDYNDNFPGTYTGPNLTKLRASYEVSGAAIVLLTDIKIIAKQEYILNGERAFRTAETDTIQSPGNTPIEFKFPVGSGIDDFDGVGRIQLYVVSETSDWVVVTTVKEKFKPLLQYKYLGLTSRYRMNPKRDPGEGGDDWIRPFAIPYLDRLLNLFAKNPRFELVYNDISKMNGGKPSDHKSHKWGNDVDLRINGYCELNLAKTECRREGVGVNSRAFLNESIPNAQNIEEILRQYPFTNKVEDEGMYVEYTRNGVVHNYLKLSCLSDHRPALEVIVPKKPHKDHFHIRFSETELPTRTISTKITLPPTQTFTQTISLQGETGGTLLVDWGDGTTDNQMQHTYSNTTTSAAIRAIYTINKPYGPTCVGISRKIGIPSLSGSVKIFPDDQGIWGLSGVRAIDNVNNFYYVFAYDATQTLYLYKLNSLTGAFVTKFKMKRFLTSIFVRPDGKLRGLAWREIKAPGPQGPGKGIEEFVEVDPSTGKETFISNIDPLKWLYIETNALEINSDSKARLYYQIGIDADNNTSLYVIDSETGKLLRHPAIEVGLSNLRINSKNELIAMRYNFNANQEIMVRVKELGVENETWTDVSVMATSPSITYISPGDVAIDRDLDVLYQYGPRESKNTDHLPKIFSGNPKDLIIDEAKLMSEKAWTKYVYAIDALTGEPRYERVVNNQNGFLNPEINSKGEVIGMQFSFKPTLPNKWTFARMKRFMEP